MANKVESITIAIEKQDSPIEGVEITFSENFPQGQQKDLRKSLLEKQNGSLAEIIELVGPKLEVGASVSIIREDLVLVISKIQKIANPKI